MVDLYLRAGNAGALAKACPFLRGDGPDGPIWLTNGQGFALDVIGPVVTKEASFDAKGKLLTAAVTDNRFHANLRCTEEIAALVPASVRTNPTSPKRVWA